MLTCVILVKAEFYTYFGHTIKYNTLKYLPVSGIVCLISEISEKKYLFSIILLYLNENI